MDGEERSTVRDGAAVKNRKPPGGRKRKLVPGNPYHSLTLTHRERAEHEAMNRRLDAYARHDRARRAAELRSVSPKVPKHDGDISLSLEGICAALSITPQQVGIRCRAGTLPWPLRDDRGKTIKPLRWQLRTLLIHEAWRKAKRTNEQRRFSREQERREDAMYRRPSLLADDPTRDNITKLRTRTLKR
jgi:hypothetical protein